MVNRIPRDSNNSVFVYLNMKYIIYLRLNVPIMISVAYSLSRDFIYYEKWEPVNRDEWWTTI